MMKTSRSKRKIRKNKVNHYDIPQASKPLDRNKPPFSRAKEDGENDGAPLKRATGKTKTAKNRQEFQSMRLNKYIAHAGICSRRKAAELVKRGLVQVNGKVVKEPYYEVKKRDKVTYKGKLLKPEEQKVYILLNKPRGLITTLKDEKGRKTVMDLLQGRIKERIYPVGRLDRDTSGLLLLTNDGELAQKLAHPKHKVKKAYHVVLDKPLSKNDLLRIAEGLELDDGKAVIDEIAYVEGKPKNEIGLVLHIGKNRIVRRIFEHLGYEVKRLDRTFYANLTKKNLPRGRFRHLTPKEVIVLKHLLHVK